MVHIAHLCPQQGNESKRGIYNYMYGSAGYLASHTLYNSIYDNLGMHGSLCHMLGKS